VDGLGALPGVHDLRVHNRHVTFDVDSAGLGAALKALTDAGVRSLVSQPPTLEELFLSHYSTSAPGMGSGPASTGDAARERVSR
jgi:ABC-2 type transport system ATP-binding protein